MGKISNQCIRHKNTINVYHMYIYIYICICKVINAERTKNRGEEKN